MAHDFADLGIDIRDLWRDGATLTPRFCLMLVGQFGETSAFAAKHRGGPEFRPWTSTTYLLAATVNLLYAANRQRGGKPTRKPMVSPPENKKVRKVTVAELLARRDAKPD